MITDGQRAWGAYQQSSVFLRRPKLTSKQREEIRERAATGEHPRDLAAEFGVTAGYIRLLAT